MRSAFPRRGNKQLMLQNAIILSSIVLVLIKSQQATSPVYMQKPRGMTSLFNKSLSLISRDNHNCATTVRGSYLR